LGKAFAQGLNEIKKSGEYPKRVKLTAPPGRFLGEGELRIIRERIFPWGREWLLAYPVYLKIPPKSQQK